jgi:hypothetical protein
MMARKLEVPSDLPSICINNQSAWVNQIKFFLISTLQVHAAAYLCQEAFPPPDDLIWFVFIGSPTETAANPSGFTFRGLTLEFGFFFGKWRAHPRQTPPTAY